MLSFLHATVISSRSNPRRFTTSLRLALCGLLLAAVAPALSRAQTITFLSHAGGFKTGSVDLPRAFAGALAADPADPNIVYAAVGGFGDNQLARVDLAANTSSIIAAGPFGSLAGIAVIAPRKLALIDSGSAVGGPVDDTILLAEDINSDNDYDDEGEIVELIAPILVDNTPPFFSGWTGTQARIAPAGDPSGIPSGSLLIQTADGAGLAELLVIENPGSTATAAYHPSGSAYYSGYDYNGGFDFDSAGNIYMGTLTSGFTGEIHALVNTNADESITSPTEVAVLVAGENGMADLVIDKSDNVYFAGVNTSFEPAIRMFAAPANPLEDSVVPEDFARLNAGFLSALALTSKTDDFLPYTTGSNATLVVSGFDAAFAPAVNLVTLRPAAGRDIADYNDSHCVNILDFLFLADFWMTVSPLGGETIGLDDFLNLLDNYQTGNC